MVMRPELSRTVPLLSQCRWSGQRHPHRIEAELISALAMGTSLDVAAADQSRPSATRAAKLIDPMRRIFNPSSWQDGNCISKRQCAPMIRLWQGQSMTLRLYNAADAEQERWEKLKERLERAVRKAGR